MLLWVISVCIGSRDSVATFESVSSLLPSRPDSLSGVF